MILAIDQGTTGTTCLVVDEDLRVRRPRLRRAAAALPAAGLGRARSRRRSGQSVLAAGRADARASAQALDAIGITNQRETTVLWDRRRAGPWHRRSSGRTGGRPSAAASSPADLLRERTGLVPDPYFSATKLRGCSREHGGPRRSRSARSTAGSSGSSPAATRPRDRRDERLAHAARRRCATLDWDDELLELFGVDRSAAAARSSARPSRSRRGASCSARACRSRDRRRPAGGALRTGLPAAGDGKATYGTGTFVLVHTGDDAVGPPHGLLRDAPRAGRLRARGLRPRRRRRGAVAARRARAARRRGRERSGSRRASTRPAASTSCRR